MSHLQRQSDNPDKAVGENAIAQFLASIDNTRDPRRKCRSSFELRAGMRPKEHPLLSGKLMQIIVPPGRGAAIHLSNIHFSAKFVDYVAGNLQLGLTEERKGMIVYLSQTWNDFDSVIACYTDLSFPVVLWREPRVPEWVA